MAGSSEQDTICAIATPPGTGGVGIIRVSGGQAVQVARRVAGQPGPARRACLRSFRDRGSELIDRGLMIYFPAPNSFTGEDVIELHAHGGVMLLQMLLEALVDQGARPARPGEFSERAFLNDKLDLAQAEAIADLISAGSTAAVRAAQRSLQGGISEPVQELLELLIELRVWVEAALDFPDEEIDFMAEPQLRERCRELKDKAQHLLELARQGRKLLQGGRIAILGPTNAGKSSLLNALLKRDAAIVTDIPGTTRDVLRERLEIRGLGVEIVDTAGLRESEDPVEIEGIRRAREMLAGADLLLWVEDALLLPGQTAPPPETDAAVLRVINKSDLISEAEIAALEQAVDGAVVVSAKTGAGLDRLEDALLEQLDYSGTGAEAISARPRHIAALQLVVDHLQLAGEQMQRSTGELLAEELHAAQQALAEITGEFHSDDLLGEIFSSFCIGK